MTPQGLRPHTHQERAAIVAQLIPRWQHKFGADLRAVATTASFARGGDRAYSDLEFIVFLTKLPPPDEDQYLQRIVDGLLVEAIYVTEDDYLQQFATVTPDWPMVHAAVLVGVYNPAVVAHITEQIHQRQYPRTQFIACAAKRWYEVQEAYGKVLSAIDQRNHQGISLLVFDAALHTVITLALLNEQSLTTFATYIAQARSFRHKPPSFDAFLDLLVEGRYTDLADLQTIMLAVFVGMEQMFQAAGWSLYDDTFDPNVPNTRFLSS